MSTSLIFFQDVQPKAGTPGAVQESAPAGGAPGAAGQPPPPSMFSMLLPFLILLPFLWMMFRRQKKEAAERAKLKKGDRVMTQAGLVGELVELAEPISKLKVAAGVTVEVLTTSLTALPQTKKDDVKVDAKVAAEKK